MPANYSHTQPVLHSKKFFHLFRVGCCFCDCLSPSHFSLMSVPAAPHPSTPLYTHTHTPIIISARLQEASCPVPVLRMTTANLVKSEAVAKSQVSSQVASLLQQSLPVRFLASRESPADRFQNQSHRVDNSLNWF